MMVLPLLIFVLLPKVVNTINKYAEFQHELPDISEFMTRLFSSKSPGKSSSGSSKTSKSGAGKRK
ncbi:EMC7-like [Ictidomys tridecemlineatus]|uniref:Uncharacterized protein n=1 Tax=Ictidomys tridecemlineatus TaxID=43179 RepID=A0A287DDV2_ICTTR|nr:EMC7-like [Ictidomys tridecemlineatus]